MYSAWKGACLVNGCEIVCDWCCFLCSRKGREEEMEPEEEQARGKQVAGERLLAGLLAHSLAWCSHKKTRAGSRKKANTPLRKQTQKQSQLNPFNGTHTSNSFFAAARSQNCEPAQESREKRAFLQYILVQSVLPWPSQRAQRADFKALEFLTILSAATGICIYLQGKWSLRIYGPAYIELTVAFIQISGKCMTKFKSL